MLLPARCGFETEPRLLFDSLETLLPIGTYSESGGSAIIISSFPPSGSGFIEGMGSSRKLARKSCR